MELLLYLGVGWLATIGISYGMLVATTAKLFKDAADNGYKFQIARVDSEKVNIIKESDQRKHHLLVPFVNILEMIIYAATSKSPEFIEELMRSGRLIEMNQEEIEIYKSTPNIKNAVSISMRSSHILPEHLPKMKNNNTISINDNTIEFVVQNHQVYIIDVKGKISKLKKEEQGEILMDCLGCMTEMAKKQGISAMDFDKKLEDGEVNFAVNIDRKPKSDENQVNRNLSKEEYYFFVKKFLYDFREQLVNGNIQAEPQGKKPKQKL